MMTGKRIAWLLVSGVCHAQNIRLIQPQPDGSLVLWGNGNRRPAQDGFVYRLRVSSRGELLETHAWWSEGTPMLLGGQAVVWHGWQQGRQTLLPPEALDEINVGFSVMEALP